MQAIFLTLFNSAEALTLREIRDCTGVSEDECRRHLLSLTVKQQELLSKESCGQSQEVLLSTKFYPNKNFQHKRLRLKISLLKAKEKNEKKIEKSNAPQDRKHVVDSVIVRIMKARKKLEHRQLEEEVVKNCSMFKPQPSQIKEQVEQLIDREFIKRHADRRDVYVYLP